MFLGRCQARRLGILTLPSQGASGQGCSEDTPLAALRDSRCLPDPGGAAANQTKSPASWGLYSGRRDGRQTPSGRARSRTVQHARPSLDCWTETPRTNRRPASVLPAPSPELGSPRCRSFPAGARSSSHRRRSSVCRSGSPHLWGPFVRARAPFTRLHLHDLTTSPKAHLLTPSHEVRIPTQDSGEPRLRSQQVVTGPPLRGPSGHQLCRPRGPSRLTQQRPVFPLANSLLPSLSGLLPVGHTNK